MTTDPTASHPRIANSVLTQDDDKLLPWSWARHRLASSENYWLSTVWPDGRPHCVPIWGVWTHNTFWFYSGNTSRKIRNLTAEPRCAITTENPAEAILLEGEAFIIDDEPNRHHFHAEMANKYGPGFDPAAANPAHNSIVKVTPRRVITAPSHEFGLQPTRWTFPD